MNVLEQNGTFHFIAEMVKGLVFGGRGPSELWEGSHLRSVTKHLAFLGLSFLTSRMGPRGAFPLDRPEDKTRQHL